MVYKARQTSLNRIVAVKMILSGQFASEADVRRFRTEAEAAANLQHPNIVAIHEVGEHDGRQYFSMDYVEGKNLAQRAAEGLMPAMEAAKLVKLMAEAIQYAHQRGILHRDLKPQNVLLDGRDQPRITDFGLARRIEREEGLTVTGAVMGSPGYMAPEQAAGRQEQIGPATDVYGLGAILYHLLTGRAPFSGSTAIETLMMVVEEEPTAPGKHCPGIPADLETICLQCLEKRSERRYHTARELAEELNRFMNQEPILARPASAARKVWTWLQKHPWALTGGAALMILALFGLAYGLWERTQYLEWEQTHPGEYFRIDLSTVWLKKQMATGLYLLGLAFLSLGDAVLRGQENLRLTRRGSVLNLPLGLVVVLAGIAGTLKLIQVMVWGSKEGWWLGSSALAVLPSMLIWVGLMLAWHALHFQRAALVGTDLKHDYAPVEQRPIKEFTLFLAEILLLALLSFAAVPSGYFTPPPYHNPQDWQGLLRFDFVVIALAISMAISGARDLKTARGPRRYDSIIMGIIILTFCFASFRLPALLYAEAFLAGLLGGVCLIKAWRMSKINQRDTQASRLAARARLIQWLRSHRATCLAAMVFELLLIMALAFVLVPPVWTWRAGFFVLGAFFANLGFWGLVLRSSRDPNRERCFMVLAVWGSVCAVAGAHIPIEVSMQATGFGEVMLVVSLILLRMVSKNLMKSRRLL